MSTATDARSRFMSAEQAVNLTGTITLGATGAYTVNIGSVYRHRPEEPQ